MLDDEGVIFHGKDERVVVRFVDTREATVEGDWLIFGPLELELGAKQATKWAKAISTPKSVLEKLGVKSGQTAVLLGEYPHEFEDELRRKGLITTNRPTRSLPELVFLFLTSSKQLTRLPPIADTGVLWMIRGKGKTAPGTAMLVRMDRASLVDVVWEAGYRWGLLGVSAIFAWIDRYVVDGLVNITGFATIEAGSALRRFQTGRIRDYTVAVVVGALLLAAYGGWR